MDIFKLRWYAYLINTVIIAAPAVFLAEKLLYVFLLISKGKDFIFDSFFIMVDFMIYGLFQYKIFFDIIEGYYSLYSVLEIAVPLVISFILIEFTLLQKFKFDIGKKLLNLTVVAQRTKEVKPHQLLLRCCVKYLTLAFFPLGFLRVLVDKEKLFLHDRLARTKVILLEK